MYKLQHQSQHKLHKLLLALTLALLLAFSFAAPASADPPPLTCPEWVEVTLTPHLDWWTTPEPELAVVRVIYFNDGGLTEVTNFCRIYGYIIEDPTLPDKYAAVSVPNIIHIYWNGTDYYVTSEQTGFQRHFDDWHAEGLW